ncbi:MAG: VanZ family protein [Clostridia bacterium]|nr:VanZ family protein [Clostridia bacterium]
MRKRIILLILIVLNLATIFFFSHQDSKASGKLSSDITNQIKVHTPHYAEKTEAQQKVVHTQTQYLIRGLAHGALFFCLGILTFLFLQTFHIKWFWYFCNLPFGFLIALSDEIHQLYVPGRTFGWDDISYDMLGFSSGMFVVLILMLIFKLLHKKTVTK